MVRRRTRHRTRLCKYTNMHALYTSLYYYGHHSNVYPECTKTELAPFIKDVLQGQRTSRPNYHHYSGDQAPIIIHCCPEKPPTAQNSPKMMSGLCTGNARCTGTRELGIAKHGPRARKTSSCSFWGLQLRKCRAVIPFCSGGCKSVVPSLLFATGVAKAL